MNFLSTGATDNDIVEDLRPGAYYVGVVNGNRWEMLAGPVATRRAALDLMPAVGELAVQVDAWIAFYGFGIVRMELGADLPRGSLNDLVVGVE